MSTDVDQDIHVTESDDARQEEIDAALKLSKPELIPVALIEKAEVALRGVQRQNEQYQLLVSSIRKKGVLNSIVVRRFEMPGGVVRYGLIDGLQRTTACEDLGLTHIPANVVEMDDGEVLEAQVITNMNRVITKPADLSKHLLRMLAANPLMTSKDLAAKVHQSEQWVEDRLSLNKLSPEIQKLVNDGKIHLTNAYALSKIPAEEQGEHVSAAMTQAPATFVPSMKARAKEIKEANRKGTDPGKAEFKPQQHFQKLGEVKEIYQALIDGKTNPLVSLLERNNATTPLEVARMTLAWVLHFDPDSQAEQVRKNEERKAAEAEKKERLKAEREKKRADEAAAKAADITSF